ncbi:thioesterase [Pycnococcus provasolii]
MPGSQVMMATSSSLIKLHAINALARDCSVNLFCFPYGGGNARAYDEAWAQSLPPHIQAYAFELPGRGSLSNAPTINDINVLVKAAAAAMREHLDRPFAIFGHSVGAVMAWALARHLETRGDHHTPIVTICSGHTAPSQPTTQMHKWSTDELANEMRGWGNVDEEVLSDPDVVEFLCKTLRSDFEITETFCGTTEALNMERLRCRLVVCGGDADPLVSSEELRIWHEECAETTTTRRRPPRHECTLVTTSTSRTKTTPRTSSDIWLLILTWRWKNKSRTRMPFTVESSGPLARSLGQRKASCTRCAFSTTASHLQTNLPCLVTAASRRRTATVMATRRRSASRSRSPSCAHVPRSLLRRYGHVTELRKKKSSHCSWSAAWTSQLLFSAFCRPVRHTLSCLAALRRAFLRNNSRLHPRWLL